MGFNDKNVFPHNSKGCKVRDRGQTRSDSDESSSWLVDGRPPAVSLQDLLFVHPLGKEEGQRGTEA